MNYYNEFDLFAAAWLRELIKAGHIAPGEVDERSITEVKANDLKGFTQCHFFAGIGGWSLALRLAGWPDNRPVWTGSCPCQPFSSAGNKKGKSDDRHLWPVWFQLIRKSAPIIVFGEQVPTAINHGWWDDVADDLEGEGYTTRSEIRSAISVGASHRRDRLWFVAHAKSERCGETKHDSQRQTQRVTCGRSVADAISDIREPRWPSDAEQSAHGWHADRGSFFDANPTSQGLSERKQSALGSPAREPEFKRQDCPRGEWWSVEPRMGRVANGVLNRVGKLRGYGNAVVPQVAAEFIRAAS